MTTEYDLIVIGTGSGNSVIGPEMDGMRIAIVERETFGGTCVNRGCIPSKMLIFPADLAEHAKHGERLGIHTEFHGADWPSIVKRVFARIDPIAVSGREYRLGLPNVDVYETEAHFIGDRELEAFGADPHRARRVHDLDLDDPREIDELREAERCVEIRVPHIQVKAQALGAGHG